MANRSNDRARERPMDASRRRVLAKLGAFAAYTAPVMTTLLVAGEARADHRPGHVVVGPVNPPHPCDNPNLPGCSEVRCDQHPELPGCGPVGSLGAGPESGAFGEPDPYVGHDDGAFTEP